MKGVQGAFCDHLRNGHWPVHAAALAGISEADALKWYRAGASEKRGANRDFYLAVQRAEAEFVDRHLKVIESGCPGNPGLSVALIRQRFPHLFGRRDGVEEKGADARAADAQALREMALDKLERLLPPEPEAKVLELVPAPEPTGG